MKHVVVRPAAAADIEDAYQWYESQRPGLGAALRARHDDRRTEAASVAWITRDTSVVHATRHPAEIGAPASYATTCTSRPCNAR